MTGALEMPHIARDGKMMCQTIGCEPRKETPTRRLFNSLREGYRFGMHLPLY